MSRARKLLIVGLVLATGIGLSLPFRKSATSWQAERTRALDATRTSEPVDRTRFAPGPRPESHGTQVVAKMTSTGDRPQHGSSPHPVAGFDLADHPTFSAGPVGFEQPVTPKQPPRRIGSRQPSEPRVRPAYETIRRDAEGDASWPREVVHIVADGDTLEKLAKRYMGESSRALEIFDMNRTRLSNPHQLPIGAELRVPVAPGRLRD